MHELPTEVNLNTTTARCTVYRAMGQLLAAKNNDAEAITWHQKALNLLDTLQPAPPMRAIYLRDLCASYSRLGRLQELRCPEAQLLEAYFYAQDDTSYRSLLKEIVDRYTANKWAHLMPWTEYDYARFAIVVADMQHEEYPRLLNEFVAAACHDAATEEP